jgi:energy-coupling factor transporter ATP-binding protein EcfA2
MPCARVVKRVEVLCSARVRQVEGMFDLARSRELTRTWDVSLPIEERGWHVGLMVGPSGSGKSSIARALFGEALVAGWDWPRDGALVDGFPQEMSITEVTGLLSSVGFSSPPSWLRPFRTLSMGEQFRATIARTLAERPALAVVDEYSSLVDRRVARIGSAALSKTIRAGEQRLVAVTCHEDVEEWLDPDWVYRTDRNEFTWRGLRRRPAVTLDIRVGRRAEWRCFRDHHYLSGSLSPAARCYVGLVEGMAAVWTAVLYWPHPVRPGWREHRTVCLPDFQGIGLGNAMSEFVAGMYRATGRAYRSVTSSPAMIRHRAKSPLWRMTRSPGRVPSRPAHRTLGRRSSVDRRTASFEYVGPVLTEEAARFGIIERKAGPPGGRAQRQEWPT